MEYGFRTLRESHYWMIEGSLDLRVVRLTRLETALPTVEAVNESFDAIRAAICHLPLDRWGLVFDMRQAKPAHDPEIENAFRENRKRIYRPFCRMSVVLASAAGVLQVKRMLLKAPDPKIGVFDDEREALAWASSDAIQGCDRDAAG